MKKAIPILAIVILMIIMTSVTAFAHGGYGSGYGGWMRQQPRYELCTVDGCNLSGPHQHNGIWYCNQTGAYVNYEICSVEGCTQIGIHEHDGAYYRCASYGAVRGCGRVWNR